MRKRETFFYCVLSLIYDAVLWFFDSVIHTFFREVRSRGSFNIPRKGPVIFVCAPHHNLFIDPLILMMTSRKESGRRISLLTAAKTYKTWHVGTAARLCSAIPVERAQDLVKPRDGKIKIEDFGPENDNLIVIGEGTHFLRDAQAKGLIGLQDYLGNAKIKSVESDHKLILQKPFSVRFKDPSQREKRIIKALQEGYSYVLAPHIDNEKTFESVFKHLLEGRALGIFPEGGSHDRTNLLPLKPGVALMALGAAAKSVDPDISVKIVPVGLNYFNANRFRSSVVIEYGKPIVITKKESARYEENSREIVNEYLEMITLRLQEVTVTCDDIDTLTAIQTARRLYAPTDRDSTPLSMKVEMTRRLIKGYEKHSHKPDVQEMKSSMIKYNKRLMQLGLRDHQVNSIEQLNRWSVLVTLMNRASKCLIFLCLSIPGIVMFSPIFIIANRISNKKAKEALASSFVKIKGKDVIASWKIIVALGLAPMLYVFWAIIGTTYLLKCEWTSQAPVWALFLLCYLLNIFITYSSLRTGEIGYDYFTSLLPLTYSLFSKHKDMLQIEELNNSRKSLALQITAFCERYGPSIFDDYTKFYRNYKHEMTSNDYDADSDFTHTRGDNAYFPLFLSLNSLAEVPIFSHFPDSSSYGSSDDSEGEGSDCSTSKAVENASINSNASIYEAAQARIRRPKGPETSLSQ